MPQAKQLRNSAKTLDARKRRSVTSIVSDRGRVSKKFKLRLCDHDSSVSGLQRIIARRAGSRQSDVNDGGPAFQFVVSVTMKNIGGTDGDTGGTYLDERKPGVIIDGIVGQKYFLAAAAAHVQRREIVQSTGRSNASE